MPTDAGAAPRSRFGPVVLAGLLGSGVATLGATKAWFELTPAQDSLLAAGAVDASGQVPLAVSLGLACLASWGALLVTRGGVRRALSMVGALSALALLVTWAWAWRSVPAGLERQAAQLGAPGLDAAAAGWFWLSGAAAVVAAGAAVAGVRLAPGWPEMGGRYDAPAASGRETGSRSEGEATSLDLWRALDEGRDPTGTEE